MRARNSVFFAKNYNLLFSLLKEYAEIYPYFAIPHSKFTFKRLFFSSALAWQQRRDDDNNDSGGEMECRLYYMDWLKTRSAIRVGFSFSVFGSRSSLSKVIRACEESAATSNVADYELAYIMGFE